MAFRRLQNFIGALSLNLQPNVTVDRDMFIVEPDEQDRDLPAEEVPEDVLDTQRRRNNPALYAQAEAPPVYRHVVHLELPVGLALTRGNVMVTYLMRLARFFYQRDIGRGVTFPNAEPTLPQDIYTAFHIFGTNNQTGDIYIPFGVYRNVEMLRTAFANHYANENMALSPENAGLNVNADAPTERVYVTITMVHPSRRAAYPTRSNALGLNDQANIDGQTINQNEILPPRRGRAPPPPAGRGGTRGRGGAGGRRSQGRGGRGGGRIAPTNSSTSAGRGGIRARGQELVLHPNGVMLVNREEQISKLFTKRAAYIREVPVVSEDNCIMMAFMTSQCMRYEFEFNKNMNEWVLHEVDTEGPDTMQQSTRLESTRFDIDEYSQSILNRVAEDNRYVFLDSEPSRVHPGREWWIRLFNTYNPKDHIVTPHEEYMWTLTGHIFEAQLSSALVRNNREYIESNELTEREFLQQYDFSDIYQACQVLSDLLDVFISVYDLNGGGNRFYSFTPEHQTPLEYLNRKYQARAEEEGRGNADTKISIRMVNLLYDKGHMHGITNIHQFHSKDYDTTYRKYQYCPFCETLGGSTFRNKANLNKHILDQKCLTKVMAVKSIQGIQELLKTQACTPASYKFHVPSKCMEWCCYRCYVPVYSSEALLHHVCNAEIRSKPKDIISKTKIFSYDFEAAQISMAQWGNPNQFYHVTNCVCMIPAYYEDEELSEHPDKDGKHFHTEDSFLEHLFHPDNEELYKDALFFAHNGGSYDVTFIIRYMENNRRSHTWLPRPGSHHKFISVTDTKTGITFVDFRMFMSGSLSSIGESMKLPIAKGIFPHSFNNGVNTFYEGCVPPIDTHEDWWSLKWAKTDKNIEDIREFHNELCANYCTCADIHCCEKPLWKLQEQMIYYCMIDVKLLAQCIVRFRTKVMDLAMSNCTWEHWKPVLVDPYWYVTTPQLCQAMLLMGFRKKGRYGGGIPSDYCDIVSVEKKKRVGQTIEALQWLNNLPNRQDIYHRGNWHREYYSFESGLFADGYDEKTKTAYVCIDCNIYACKDCFGHTDVWHSTHPLYGDKTYAQVYDTHRLDLYDRWQRAWGARDGDQPAIENVIIRPQCQIRNEFGPITEYQRYAYEIGYNGIDGMKGGRTEVFKVLYEKSEDPDETINYDDVCSLYPYVCAFKEIPLGLPQYIQGEDIVPERLFSTDRNWKYWGFIHCKVKPNHNDLLGLLPNRRSGDGDEDSVPRLMFTLDEQVGTWFIEEVEFAIQHGYQVTEVYNIFHWDINKRSDRKFRPYVDCFIKLKQQSEKWSKLGASCDQPSEEEKIAVAERLFESNGNIGRIDVNRVEENPVMRALMKLFLNNMWGKWAQKDSDTIMCTIYGAKQFYELWDHPMVNRAGCTFREICPDSSVYKAQIGLRDEYQKNAGRTNFFIGGAVTAHARLVLHARMIRIGPERMIYCDTDSVIYRWNKKLPVLTSQGLGQWEKEKGQPIKRVLAIAPKFYVLEYDDPDEELAIKSKGVVMSLPNRHTLSKERLLEMIFSTLQGDTSDLNRIALQNFTIRTNTCTSNQLNFYVMCSLYNNKVVKLNITKRHILLPEDLLLKLGNRAQWSTIKEVSTTPIGYIAGR